MKLLRLFFVLVVFVAASAKAQKPAWLDNTPQELNYTYKIVEVVSYGDTKDAARVKALENLSSDQQLIEGVRIYQKTQKESVKDKKRVDAGPLHQVQHDHIVVNTVIDGNTVNLNANRIDEYATQEYGRVKLHTLYQVATCDNPIFDNVYLTTKYGARGLWRSAICPGWGQMYKGSIAKGVSILAAEVLTIGGIIFTENERAVYVSKMRSQPNFARQYKSRADNYETARNCCIGAAAAVYLYNLIDAIVAPGAKRVVVKPRNMQIAPVASTDFGGVAFSYNF